MWRGTFPLSPISELTYFSSEADRVTPEIEVVYRPQERIATEDEELILLVRSFDGRVQHSRLSRHREDELLEHKIIKIQRFWRAYRTRKIIAVYLELMQSH